MARQRQQRARRRRHRGGGVNGAMVGETLGGLPGSWEGNLPRAETLGLLEQAQKLASKLLQKALDRRHPSAIALFKDAEVVRALWSNAVQRAA